MFRLSSVNFRKALVLSRKTSRLLNSRFSISELSTSVSVRWRCDVCACARNTRASVRLDYPCQSSRPTYGAPSLQPSTHGGDVLYSKQGQKSLVQARHFSTSNCKAADNHNENNERPRRSTGKSDKNTPTRGESGGRRRGPPRGLRRSDKTATTTTSDSNDGSDQSHEADHFVDETDEFVDIHSPKGLESESANEFDDEYFTNLHSRQNSPADVNDFESEMRTESHSHQAAKSSVNEERNEFDEQYFAETSKFDSAWYKKEDTKNVEYINKQHQVSDPGLNAIDEQYFGKTNLSALPSRVRERGLFQRNNIDRSESTSAFIDTSCSEESILDEIKKRNEMDRLVKEEAALAAMMSELQTKYEPHESATRINFSQKSNTELHDKVEFLDDKLPVIKGTIPQDLQKRLKQERKIIEEENVDYSPSRLELLKRYEDIEPEVQSTILSLKKPKKKRTSPAIKSHGTADPEMASSNTPCSGCGALLQCNSVDTPGFMPTEKFVPFMEDVEKGRHSRIMRAVCIRCWNLVKQREALNVNVIQEDYTNIIKAIRKKRALVLVMVDLLDFPCSIIPNLKDIIGSKHVCLIGNKVDLLPVDDKSTQYTHRRIGKQMLQACLDSGVCSKENVKEILMISAKTGYGIERLISRMHRNWGTQGDVYILGTANVGKSTLFNRLLESDYCKSKASYLLGKATISRWPGTTLNLLRFPILSMSRTRVGERADRLKAEKKKEGLVREEVKERKEKERKVDGDEDGTKRKYDHTGYVKGNVGRTFDYYKVPEMEKELDFDLEQDPFNMAPRQRWDPSDAMPKMRKEEAPLPFKFHPKEFDDGHWFYDTPGVIHDQQIFTKLTLEELRSVVPGAAIQPKTLILKPGHSFFLAGLGRLDYVKGNAAIYFTVFTCKLLPVRVVPTERADEFYKEHAGNKYLAVPIGGEERMKTFPAMKSVDLQVTGIGWNESVADILFSSAGWASITTGQGMTVDLRAYTPGGKGCLLRQPALLPYAVLMRGRREKGTPFYAVVKDRLVRYL